MIAESERQLPPGDRTDAPELKPKKPVTIFPCNTALRSQLLQLHDNDGWSINEMAKKCGVNSAVVSQYLHEAGCVYPGSVSNFEKKAMDMLRNEARRRASGVETIECKASKEMRAAFEYIRKTNDIGAVVAESGDGKSRGVEPYLIQSPTCRFFNVCSWHRHESALRKFFFDSAPKGDWDKQTNWMDYAVTKLRGSDRLFIFDNAHKLPLRSLQLIVDFHDETQCPVGLVGTMALIELLSKDPQLHSRVGLHWTIGAGRPQELIEHIVKSLIPNINGELPELMALCEQVAAQPGHFRAVHKQLKLAVELRESSDKIKTWCMAFKGAHSKMLRDYPLN